MALMITDGQKSYIRELLERVEAKLADFTGKELEKLTCREAADVIDELKGELFNRRMKGTLFKRNQDNKY